METITPRNAPGSQAMTQDNVVKAPVYMPTPENTAGNESGVSNTAGMGTTAGTQAIFQAPTNNINISASTENRSAKFKNGEGGPKFDPGQYGNDQYNGK
jgi:hypothetical protein